MLKQGKQLLNLNVKTSGDAEEIVSKAALTNVGFNVAWSSLRQRFENKRFLGNSQLFNLFDLLLW